MRAPPSGRQVAVGRLRVDAARAIAKLREYQLAEPAAWILEAIRAAVASGATAIDLQGDSNDIWLQWQGRPWDREVLPNLLSELVSPQGADQGQQLRLLATAINTALGLPTAYLDLYRIEDGEAQKVRFLPTVLKGSSEPGSSSELASLRLEDTEVPALARNAGMFLHLRRRFGLAPLRNLWRGESPELPIARAACGELSIPISIADEVLGAQHNERDLLRVKLERGIDGFLALTKFDPDANPSTMIPMEIAEHGVHIVSYEVDPGLRRIERLGIPLRLYVTAEQMPTNASHTEVRRDEYPVRDALQQLPKLLEKLVTVLEAELRLDGPTPALCDAAVALLVASANFSGDLCAPLLPLQPLPLLRNAVGSQRAFNALWIRAQWNGTVYRGDKPLPDEFAPWVEDILWTPPGSPQALLPSNVSPDAMEIVIRAARQHLRTLKKFRAHEPRAAALDATIRHRGRGDIDPRWAGSDLEPIDGEICLLPEGTGGTLLLLFEGREIEEFEIDSDLPFFAIVDASTLSPAPDYKSVVRNTAYENLVAAVKSAAICCVENLATPSRPLVLAALKMAARSSRDLMDSPLARARVWALVDGTLVSLRKLSKQSLVGLATTQMVSMPEGRTAVFCKQTWEKVLLQSALKSHTVVVDYSYRSCDAPSRVAEKLRANFESLGSKMVALSILDDRRRGAIAWISPWTCKPALKIYHCGRLLCQRPYTSDLGPLNIAVDSDDVIPSHNWNGLEGSLADDFDDWKRQLIVATTLAILGRPPQKLKYYGQLRLDEFLGECLATAIANCDDPKALLGDELFEELQAAPLFRLANDCLVSANEIASRFPAEIDYLATRPNQSSSAWQPIIATKSVAAMAARLSNRDSREASAELKTREATNQRRENLAAHRRCDPVEANLLVDAPAVIEISDEGYQGHVGIHPLPEQILELHFHIEGRAFQIIRRPHPVPLIAVVEVSEDQTDSRFEEVEAEIRESVVLNVSSAGSDLLEAALDEDARALISQPKIREFYLLWTKHVGTTPHAVKQRQSLGSLTRWLDQRGELVALHDAIRRNKLAFSAHTDTWLEASEGVQAHELDAPILFIRKPALMMPVLASLVAPTRLIDQSIAMQTLQFRRKIDQGLTPGLSVPGSQELRCSLAELSDEETIGEIAFQDAGCSEVRLHRSATAFEEVALNVLPAVVIAIEDPGDRLGLRSRVEKLAALLLTKVLATEDIELPSWLCRQLCRGLLSGDLPPSATKAVSRLPLFETTSGQRLSWIEVLLQADRMGSVWYTGPLDRRQPLSSSRLVLALYPHEIPATFTKDIVFVQAGRALQLDQLARKNRDGGALPEMQLSKQQQSDVLTVTRLEGVDGLQGIVAPLKPSALASRGVSVYRNTHPLGRDIDPCSWPTLAIIDDAKAEPNRTWSTPLLNERWKMVRGVIERASKAALVEHLSPIGAICSHWIGLDFGAIRGHLWLSDSTAPGTINLRMSDSATRIQDFGALPVHGDLLLSTTVTSSLRERVEKILDIVYPLLLSKILDDPDLDADCRAAHLALGLVTNHVTPEVLGEFRFPCFTPGPITAAELLTLVRSTTSYARQGPALVDDGSALSEVLTQYINPNQHDAAPVQLLFEPPAPVAVVHALDPLAQALHARLVQLGLGQSIDGVVIAPDLSAPLLSVVDRCLTLAGGHAHLLSLEAQRLASHQAALDLLAAHAFTVLNQSSTTVTDAAEEHALLMLLRCED